MRIHQSAYKHGVTDDDIHHVIEYARYIGEEEDEDRRLYLGPDEAANMLEVISLLEDDEELVIHAMPMQNKYRPLLRGLGDPNV